MHFIAFKSHITSIELRLFRFAPLIGLSPTTRSLTELTQRVHYTIFVFIFIRRPKEEPEEEPSADAPTPSAPQHKANAAPDAPSAGDEVLVQNPEDYSQFFARKGRNAPAASPGDRKSVV